MVIGESVLRNSCAHAGGEGGQQGDHWWVESIICVTVRGMKQLQPCGTEAQALLSVQLEIKKENKKNKKKNTT